MKERPSTGISASLLAIFRFSRDDWLLPADWIRSGIGSWSGKRVFHDFASVVLGTFCRLHLQSGFGNSAAPSNAR